MPYRQNSLLPPPRRAETPAPEKTYMMTRQYIVIDPTDSQPSRVMMYRDFNRWLTAEALERATLTIIRLD
jgi:hypothetical protein